LNPDRKKKLLSSTKQLGQLCSTLAPYPTALGGKQPEHKTGPSAPSSAKDNKERNYTFAPNYFTVYCLSTQTILHLK
jgi:hypothetical protein